MAKRETGSLATWKEDWPWFIAAYALAPVAGALGGLFVLIVVVPPFKWFFWNVFALVVRAIYG